MCERCVGVGVQANRMKPPSLCKRISIGVAVCVYVCVHVSQSKTDALPPLNAQNPHHSLPGEMPPMSAWWPRLATKNTIRFPFPPPLGPLPSSSPPPPPPPPPPPLVSPPLNTGVMTVMSGRWLPPASCGWLLRSTSPSDSPSAAPGPPGP